MSWLQKHKEFRAEEKRFDSFIRSGTITREFFDIPGYKLILKSVGDSNGIGSINFYKTRLKNPFTLNLIYESLVTGNKFAAVANFDDDHLHSIYCAVGVPAKKKKN